MKHRMLALLFGILLASVSAHAAEIRIVAWNVDGTNLAGREQETLQFAQETQPDIIIAEELLEASQITTVLSDAGLTGWNSTVSDFKRDSTTNPHSKLEVGIASHFALSGRLEVDPILGDDDDADDVKLVPSDVLPTDQHNNKGSRGYLWVEIPDLKLAVAAVHLKSSLGMTGQADEVNSFKREAVISSLAERITSDQASRPDWSYLVAGDFNVSPGDTGKVGSDITLRCQQAACTGYDQTHALLGGGLVNGLRMENFTEHLGHTFAAGGSQFVDSPIDNIYAIGPLFETLTAYSVGRYGPYGSDHFAVRLNIETAQ